MQRQFKIYIDRLKHEEKESIDQEVPSEFLDVREEDLSFPTPVKIKGEAYLADEHLILHLHLKTTAALPCAICNQLVQIPISIDDFYHSEPIDELRSPTFDYTEALREAILLQVPPFAECHRGNCPERATISPYLKKKDPKTETPSHFPFADLDK